VALKDDVNLHYIMLNQDDKYTSCRKRMGRIALLKSFFLLVRKNAFRSSSLSSTNLVPAIILNSKQTKFIQQSLKRQES